MLPCNYYITCYRTTLLCHASMNATMLCNYAMSICHAPSPGFYAMIPYHAVPPWQFHATMLCQYAMLPCHAPLPGFYAMIPYHAVQPWQFHATIIFYFGVPSFSASHQCVATYKTSVTQMTSSDRFVTSFRHIIASHHCVTSLRHITASHHCVTSLRHVTVWHHCVTSLRHITASQYSHHCVTSLCHITVSLTAWYIPTAISASHCCVTHHITSLHHIAASLTASHFCITLLHHSPHDIHAANSASHHFITWLCQIAASLTALRRVTPLHHVTVPHCCVTHRITPRHTTASQVSFSVTLRKGETLRLFKKNLK